jgi:hypothetical protein
MSAFVTLLKVSAECSGATTTEGIEYGMVQRAENVRTTVVVAVAVDNIGEFKAGLGGRCFHAHSIAHLEP